MSNKKQGAVQTFYYVGDVDGYGCLYSQIQDGAITLYTRPDAVEIDKAYAEVWEKARGLQSEIDGVIAERDTLRAKLVERDALLRRAVETAGEHYLGHDLYNDICDTLYASTELKNKGTQE